MFVIHVKSRVQFRSNRWNSFAKKSFGNFKFWAVWSMSLKVSWGVEDEVISNTLSAISDVFFLVPVLLKRFSNLPSKTLSRVATKSESRSEEKKELFAAARFLSHYNKTLKCFAWGIKNLWHQGRILRNCNCEGVGRKLNDIYFHW